MAGKDIDYFGSDDIAGPQINIIDFDNYRIKNTWSHHEITEEQDEDEDEFRGRRLMPSINEEGDESDLLYNNSKGKVSEVVYVVTATATDELLSASMDALVWTLGSDLGESSIVYLVHVFPELRFIPTPLGRLPINHANPEQKEVYINQERNKRNDCLQKFLSLCTSSKVQVETVIIESDLEAKAILDLIPILNIRKLVMGATKSTLRKLRGSSKKGAGTIDQIVHNAPQFCEVKIICEGKEVSLQEQLSSFSPSSTAPSPREMTLQPTPDQANGFVKCSCFKL